jgi:uncharacterized protein (TIRG00374 family)
MISSIFTGFQSIPGPPGGAPLLEASIGKRKWTWSALLVVVLLLAGACLFWSQASQHGFRWKVFFSTMAGLRWDWLLLATALALVTYYGRALRWAVLLKPVRAQPRMWNLVSATVIGFTAVTLLGRPGEFVRPYLISVKERVPFSSQLAAWLLERIFDLLMALFVFGFALSRLRNSAVEVGPGLSWVLEVGGGIVGILALVCLLLLVLLRHFSTAMQRRLMDALEFLPERHLRKAHELVSAFVQGVESTRSHSSLLLLIFYTALEWFLIAACYVCIARAYGNLLNFGWVDVLIFLGFVAFGSVVQIPGVGGGVQVVSVLVLNELFGVSLEVATSVALLVWIITFVVIAPFGMILALHEGLNWRKLKEIEREVMV